MRAGILNNVAQEVNEAGDFEGSLASFAAGVKKSLREYFISLQESGS